MRTMSRMCCLLLGCLWSGAAMGAQEAIHKPNLDLYVYRRCVTTDELVKDLRLSTYNLSVVRFAARRIDLGEAIRASRRRKDLGEQIARIDLRSLPIVRSWEFTVKSGYAERWSESAVTIPPLPPGAYVLTAAGADVEKRTWMVVTDIALIAKRSREEMLLFAADARSGKPVGGLQLTLMQASGVSRSVTTDVAGIWRGAVPPGADGPSSGVWAYGVHAGHPAFLLNSAPAPVPPYLVYAFTDRPIYRPGHKVQYKATVRERIANLSAPGGLEYRPFANRKVVVEVRDPTDALIQRREVLTNANGSLDGTLQLAPEPALGSWQLVVAIGDHRDYARFDVEAYRKPEYAVQVRFDKPHFVGGSTVPVTISAQYYFGQPVADAQVRYTIRFGGLDGTGEVEPPYQGMAATDARGELRLQIKTKRLPGNRNLTVAASVTDLSRRTQNAAASTLVTSGLFRIATGTDRWLYHPGDRATVSVRAEDYDGKPVPTKVTLRLIETKEDREHRTYHETTTRAVVTDSAGKASAVFPLPRPGYLDLQAQAFDSDDNKIVASGSIWVSGPEFVGYEYPTLSLQPDKAEYRPGEVATLLLNTSLVTPPGTPHKTPGPAYPDAWALITVEGEHLYRSEVIHLTSRSTSFRVPLTSLHFPSTRVRAAMVQGRHLLTQDVILPVAMDDQKLTVRVTSDRDRYLPGESATYTVEARDHRGNPAATEVSLGVVDSAVYAIRQDTAPALQSYFYGGSDIRVSTDFSFAAQYSGGAFQGVPPAKMAPSGGQAAPGIRVRRLFADTAYWNPFVTTGADGRASVSFAMPDNLTTWRATARAISQSTKVGEATQEALVTMPLLVRLELPRFYVEGDEAVVSAVVHNYTREARDVSARADVAGLALSGDPTTTVHLPPDGQKRIDWRATIGKLADSQQASAPSVRIAVVADGGQGAQDAAELTLPVRAVGLKMVEASAGALDARETSREFAVKDIPAGAEVTATLSPSVASAMFDALEYLAAYPYGCAEQTTSAFLPDVVVTGALGRLGVDRPVHPKLREWVNIGLQKLYRYQHQDGGWNWWEFDETDGDMTAYVLYGLLQARAAGHLVDDQRILRGTECLLRMLAQERELSRRADWIMTLAQVRPERVAKAADELFDKREKLDAHAQASLCMALARLDAPGPAKARTLARELAQRAVELGTTAHWPADEGGYSWRSDDVEVTAHVLRALLAADPGSTRVRPAVLWLMGNRQGKAWNSTKTSSEAVLALTQYMEQTKELQPEYSAAVTLDGQPVKEVAASRASAFDAPVAVTLRPEQYKDHATIGVRMSGVGTLYWTLTSAYTLPADQSQPRSKGISVHRSYRVTAEDPSKADTVASGSDIEVTTEIVADANYRYAILEDPIPAGCEVMQVEDAGGQFPLAPTFDENANIRMLYARQEVRDDKVVFFLDSLPKGRTTLTYRMHAETPGRYRIRPSIANLMYFPEIRGSSGLVSAKIGERKP